MPTFEPVEHDPFASGSTTPQPAKLEPVDYDPFQETAKPGEKPKEHYAVTRGLVTGLLKQNPEMAAEALDVAAELGPEALKGPLKGASTYVAGAAKVSPEAYATRAKPLFESKGVGDVATWAGETLGSGLASTVPSLVTGGAGALVGGVPGAIAGAAVPSLAMGAGEIHKALKDEGVPGHVAAKYAAAAAIPTAALDVASLGSIVGKVGIQAAKAETVRQIAKRIAGHIAHGAGTESVTEAIQEGIKDATVSLASEKPFFTAETAKGVAEAGIGGGLVGGTMGGATAKYGRTKTTETPLTPEDIAKLTREIPAPEGPELPPATPTTTMRQMNLPFREAEPTVAPGEQAELPLGEAGALPEAAGGLTPHGAPGASDMQIRTDPENRVDPAQGELGLPPPLERGEQGTLPLPDVPTVGKPEPGKPGTIPVEDPGAMRVGEAHQGNITPSDQGLIDSIFGPGAATVAQAAVKQAPAAVAPLPQWYGGTGAVVQRKTAQTRFAAPWASAMATDVGGAAPAPTFYSRVRQFVQTKGPGAATAGQWNTTLAQAGLKKEELIDLKLPQLLAEAPNRRLTNKEILAHIDEQVTQVEEVSRSSVEPPGPEKVALTQQQFNITPEAWAALPMSHRHQLMAKTMVGWRKANAPQYQEYTTPGLRDEDVELIMHLPSADPATDYESGHFPGIPNPIAHVRLSVRRDRNGSKYVLIEEQQSDWLQRGRKFGFRGDPVKWVDIGPSVLNKEGTRLAVRINEAGNTVMIQHWPRAVDPNQRYEVTTPGYAKMFVSTLEEAKALAEPMIDQTRVPAAPFRETWAEMTFKRTLRWAADRGITQIAWVNSKEQMRRYPAYLDENGEMSAEDARRQAGMEKFYDQDTPRMARKWAKELGGVVNTVKVAGSVVDDIPYAIYDEQGSRRYQTQTFTNEVDVARIMAQNPGWNYTIDPNFEMEQEFGQLELPDAAIPFIQRGLPRYSAATQPNKVTLFDPSGLDPYKQVTPLVNALRDLIKRLNLGVSVGVELHDKTMEFVHEGEWYSMEGKFGVAANLDSLHPTIHLAVGNHKTMAELWATMTHELGHVIEATTWLRAPPSVKLSVKAAYDAFRGTRGDGEMFKNFLRRRDNAVVNYYNTRMMPQGATTTMQDIKKFDMEQYEYWTNFSEWYAEQVAKWATTSEKPLSVVEKFFSGLAKKIRDVVRQAQKMFGVSVEPTAALEEWLDAQLKLPHTNMAFAGEHGMVIDNAETVKANKSKMRPSDTAVAMQPETVAGRAATDALYKGRPPREVQEAAAYADKFNSIYKWGLGIHQVAARNLHIQPLQDYADTLAVAQLTKQQIMIRANEVEKAWNKLGEKQADAVSALIDDMQNMSYRTPDEVKAGIARFPTNAELTAMAKTHEVSAEGMDVARQISESFTDHLKRYEAIMRDDANTIGDPKKLQAAHLSITRQIESLNNRPYFPSMHFGDFTIVAHDAAGNVIHFETFETARRQRLAAEEIQSKYNIPKEQMQLGKLEADVKPLIGVPKQILRMMEERLDLSPTQRKMMKALQFDLSPTQSFKHKYQYKRRMAGYSLDFRRAYASYFFYGANHFMRAKYANRMRGLIEDTRNEVTDAYNVDKRNDIAKYMSDHMKNWLDPKPDWAGLRSVAFLWALAFSPAAAAQNLTQTLLTSYPFLASRFGDFKAIGAMTRAGTDFTTWYKRGKIATATDFELRALGKAIQDGTITEAMAPELAGFAEGRTLGLGLGHNVVQRGLNKINEMGSKWFELAEQTNRRLVFRAALKLAKENPSAKYVQDMKAIHRIQYDELIAAEWTEADAAAYVTAKAATEDTQFHYGKEYAPRFMRGKLRSVFVFKTFIQNYCLFLANYPSAAARSILILGFLGGLMAIPGAEDLKEILQAIGWRLFGRDFNLEKEARQLVVNTLGNDEFGRNAGDMILHGTARKGFGIPAAMDMLGGTVGIDVPMPTFDRSRAISGGTLLPVELGKLFGPPTQSQDKIIADQAQKASGALFGAGFNIYKALTSTQYDWSDAKRWERAVPRALASVSKSYRVGTEGKERSATGSTVVRYDVRDTEQLMEVLGIAAGYVPARQSLQWDRILASQDAVKLWHIRREGLMKQFGNAVLGGDPKEIPRARDAIVAFNKSLPPEARGQAITSDSISKSVRMKARNRAAQEGELSLRKGDIPIMRKVQQLYPESRASGPRPVPKDLLPSE